MKASTVITWTGSWELLVVDMNKSRYVYSSTFTTPCTSLQGYSCSRCLFTQHCKGCDISRNAAEVKLQPGDNLAIQFSHLTQNQMDNASSRHDHSSMDLLRSDDPLTLFDCFKAFTRRLKQYSFPLIAFSLFFNWGRWSIIAIEARCPELTLTCRMITWNVFHVSSSNFVCMLLIISSLTSSIIAEKKYILCFFTLYVTNFALWVW